MESYNQFIDSFTAVLNQGQNIFAWAAFLGGGIFFIYKLSTGWLVINLTQQIELERQKISENEDILLIHLILHKGSTDSVWIKEIQIRIREYPPNPRFPNPINTNRFCEHFIEPQGHKRLQYNKQTKKFDWNQVDYERELNISPGEGCTFCAITQVKSESTTIVETLLVGNRPWYGWFSNYPKHIQWRASKASLPNAHIVDIPLPPFPKVTIRN